MRLVSPNYVESKHSRALLSKWDALALGLVGLGLYVATLVPSVLWFDHGGLQFDAVMGTLRGAAGSHALWVWIAHQFVRIPFGEIAWRANLVSALFAAVTVGMLYLLLRDLGIQRTSSFLATLAFLVSHTFWTYAVRADVYSLTMALLVVLAWASWRWFVTGRRSYLGGAGFVLGLGLMAHPLMLLYVPATGYLLWCRRKQIAYRDFLVGLGAFALGLSPLVIVLVRDAQLMGMNVIQTIRYALFSAGGADWGHTFLDFTPRLLAADVLQWILFLGLQFPGLSGLAGIAGAVGIWKFAKRDTATYLLLLYLGTMIFSLSYRIGERYAFYLPSYLPYAVWIGVGFDWALERLKWAGRDKRVKRWVVAISLILIIGSPVGIYRLLPELTSRGISVRDTHWVPGRNAKYFFLWPPKNGYDDPRVFAEDALKETPPGALLLVDHILAAPIVFLQATEGVRPDVSIEYCCGDLQATLATHDKQTVALAVVNPERQLTDRIRRDYRVENRGPILLFYRREH